MTGRGHRARCFGHRWHSQFPLPLFDDDANTAAAPDIVIKRVGALPDRDLAQISPRMALHDCGFRFQWEQEAVFDMVDGSHIACTPLAGWTGALPVSFYSTVAAMTLAWRGMLALHASSVVLDGRAWMIAGRPGAGKSTLTAELLDAGASLLADDLTILRPTGLATRGRPAMRLHPGSAELLDAHSREQVPDDPRGKELVWPRARAADRDWPIAGLMVLGGEESRLMSGAEIAAELAAMTFRPRISARLPNIAEIKAAQLDLAGQVRGYRLPALSGFAPETRHQRTQQVLAIMAGEDAPSRALARHHHP